MRATVEADGSVQVSPDAGPALDPALETALDRFAAVDAPTTARAREELRTTLAPIARSRVGPIAWRASRLTPSGHPVELAISSANGELRTVVDPVAPEADRRQALGQALAAASAFGTPRPPAPLRDLLVAHQSGFAPRFGAWLGSRHTATATRHKLYVEVSPESGAAWDLAEELAPGTRRVLGGLGRIRFLGLHLDGSGVVEVYLRCADPDDLTVRACLGRAGFGALADAFLDAATRLDDAGARLPIGGPNQGLSLAVGHRRPVALAAFSLVPRLGGDRRVHDAVLARARRERWPSADAYAALSAPIASRPDEPRPVHTAVSIVAALGADGIEHHIGLAPPSHPHPAPSTPDSPARTKGHRS